MATQGNKKLAAERRAELAAKQAAMARAEKRRKVMFGTGAGVLVAVLVVALVLLNISRNHTDQAASVASSQTGESNLLAPVWTGLDGQVIDGVGVNSMEQTAYHIHAHLAIYVNGKQMTVPYGIGIQQPWSTTSDGNGGEFVESGAAFYYLHTHDDSGVIHIESPTTQTYKLGQFFAEWNQTLSATQIGTHTGNVTAYVNGTKYTGNPADITLSSHAVIQLDLGTVVAPAPYAFASGL
ncbi:hypothetical protein KDL01_33285 [Actinospica durhamensis]|uniref:Uncharacterized protein n=1 Tax=Actinospica durhamensis TaxID=1508375 RepID=A0A941EZM5_9ACTN|nr:hypothetical protein [Actinospica durhamensis]MBR7838194.1 hypothetical protein [Actinospica durhamensis]